MKRTSGFERDFERFFEANYDAIVRSMTAMNGNREQATDATQEAFIRAYARWGTISRYENPGAWVRRIAINVSRDLHRANQRRIRREQRHAPPEVAEPADVAGDQAARQLLQGLSEQQRAVAALYYLDDLSVAEIAGVLDIADGTVRFHLSQARERLRNGLRAGEEHDHVLG